MTSTIITDHSAIAEASRGRPLHEYLTSNKTVKIYVGPERKLWFLNEDLLCDRVPFFMGGFKGGFKEGNSKVMELPDDNPEAFGHLVDWVYKSSIECNICYASDSPVSLDWPSHELQWLRLWVLADKLNLPALAYFALGAHSACLIDCAMVVSPEAVAFACEHTSMDSAMRKYLVRKAVQTMFGSKAKFISGLGEATAANASFNQEVMEAIQNHLKLPRDGCPCYKCFLHDPTT